MMNRVRKDATPLKTTTLVGLLALTLLACSLTLPGATSAPASATPVFDEAQAAPDGWLDIAPGVAYREEAIRPSAGPSLMMQMVRFDPAQVSFRVHYRSADPLQLTGWQAQLDGALAFINASFFDEDNRALGLLVSDGQAQGQSFVGFGGMFQVDAGGVAHVRSLVQEPYRPAAFQQVVQGFPMLVEPGGVPASTGNGFDTPARRTAIAQDKSGRIYFFSTGPGEMSLRALQNWLLTTDLNLDVAVNLDGGQSSLLFLRLPGRDPLRVPGLNKVPVVLAVYPRS